ncbi:flavin reductase [Variovorax sp. OV329]|uniref:flavin reductase n=1 Tax=Variovorax sp. OV329 TaxID=1882825 RepID=UPI0008E9CA1A|nr:flavin reductase [Variovorax sp. OV329]SFM18674.1 NADH-FMN oxidoreductase RutF, flavin reductase (DIM6/NTAB) family [Variovorax sp. OV329]
MSSSATLVREEPAVQAQSQPPAASLTPIEAGLFRQLLGCFPTGVAVITTRTRDGEPAGLTCNSFSSVSLEPPLVLFSLRKASKLREVFTQAESFAINILSQSQDALSGRFASSRIENKFEGVQWRPGPLGTPLIEDCLASFECSRFACHDAGDHLVFIGQVRHMSGGPADEALVFYKGAYMMLAESLRKLVVEGRLGQPDIDEAYRTLYGTLLRLACERGTSEELDAVQVAATHIEEMPADAPLARRIETASGFFQAIATAGHNEALMLMAQTMATVLRERMTHVLPSRARPDLFPIRHRIAHHLKRREADAAVAALEELIATLRRDA